VGGAEKAVCASISPSAQKKAGRQVIEAESAHTLMSLNIFYAPNPESLFPVSHDKSHLEDKAAL
jgi:hypothetical protein